MKDARLILELVREVCPHGVFPGRGKEGRSDWPADPFHVLISTVLSQRTKDANTHAASAALFERFGTPESLAHAPLSEIVPLIHPAGFPETKAKAIKEIARRIHEDMGGEVPDDLESLLSLPMVGRKTANCVLAYAFHKPAICVDTHVHRITNRIGLVTTHDAEDTEHALEKVVPKGLWIDVNSLLVRFGQNICLPRNPRCSICPVAPHCDYFARSNPKASQRGKHRKTEGRRPKA